MVLRDLSSGWGVLWNLSTGCGGFWGPLPIDWGDPRYLSTGWGVLGNLSLDWGDLWDLSTGWGFLGTSLFSVVSLGPVLRTRQELGVLLESNPGL